MQDFFHQQYQWLKMVHSLKLTASTPEKAILNGWVSFSNISWLEGKISELKVWMSWAQKFTVTYIPRMAACKRRYILRTITLVIHVNFPGVFHMKPLLHMGYSPPTEWISETTMSKLSEMGFPVCQIMQGAWWWCPLVRRLGCLAGI